MRRIDYGVVILVLLFAMGLRISGTATFGALDDQYLPGIAPYDMLPIQAPIHPDEFQLVTWPVDMILKGSLNPQFFEYPSGMIYLNYVMFQMTGAVQSFDRAARQEANLRTIAPFKLYFFSRMYSVLAGVLSIACAYGILRRVSGRYAALIAALLVATAYLQVQHAHYTKPDIPSTALMMLVTWASIAALYARKRLTTYRLYILGGILTGAAATVRYNAAAIGLVLFLTGILLLWRYRTRQTTLVVALSWGLVPLVFFMGSPFVLIDFPEFYEQFRHITGQFLSSGKNIQPEILTNTRQGFTIVLRYLISYGLGIPATLAIFIGLCGAWRKRPQQPFKHNSELMLFGLLLPFLTAYMFITMRTVRPIFSDNLLILIAPQWLLLAAVGAGWLYAKIPVSKTLLAPTLALILLIMPLTFTIPMVRMISQVETRARMQDWIYNHIPEGSRFLLVGAYNVPLDPSVYPYELDFNSREFSLEVTQGYDYLVASDALLNLFDRANDLVTDEEFAVHQQAFAAIEAAFPRVAWIDRPRDYPAYNEMMNMAVYWHQPRLTLYCLHAAACTVVRP